MGIGRSREHQPIVLVHDNVVAAVRAALHALVTGASRNLNPDAISVRAVGVVAKCTFIGSTCVRQPFLAPVLSVAVFGAVF